mmetsp:Transcript_6942/g.22523  ORF Transcript_6942/g.22523 Transcript_6942/m.22523 type:complete len:128 (+) Transcript_6942:84-467(+)
MAEAAPLPTKAVRTFVKIRARDKASGRDLILTVPKDATMDEVMEAYTAKFNEQEGKFLSKDEFRFVSNGSTVDESSKLEDLPTSDKREAIYVGASQRVCGVVNDDDQLNDISCGCSSSSEKESCLVM